jgi:hypothetical protein
MTWATCGSACEGKSALGAQANGLFQPRQERARGAERQRDGQRTDQKPAAQLVHDVAEQ